MEVSYILDITLTEDHQMTIRLYRLESKKTEIDPINQMYINDDKSNYFYLDYNKAEKHLLNLGYSKIKEKNENEGTKALFKRKVEYETAFAAIGWIDTMD